LIAGVEVEGSEAVVARKQKLRLAGLLGQAERFLIRSEGLGTLSMALVNLAEHDQGHRQVIEQSQTAVEIDGGPRGFDAFGLAPIRQRAVGYREIGVSARQNAEIAHFLGGLEPSEARLDAPARVE